MVPIDDQRIFTRLRRAYLLALSFIALALIAEHFLVEGILKSQENDAEIINVAGRQRMLSQRIAKLSLMSGEVAPNEELSRELSEWEQRHKWLKEQLFDHPVYPELMALDTTIEAMKIGLQHDAATVVAISDRFLVRMDQVVSNVSRTAAAKVNRLRKTKQWLTLAALGILLLELLFIFRPITNFIRRQFVHLQQERDAQKIARTEAEQAYAEKDAGLKELRALNSAIDQAALFATLHHDGRVIHLSQKFQDFLEVKEGYVGQSLAELLHPDEGGQNYLADRITEARAAAWTGEVTRFNRQDEQRWLSLTIVPARQFGVNTELFVLATDITEQKAARQALSDLNEKRIAEEVERSQRRSQQIVNAQENERLRIARDLHDGIGQKLTALKFSLESINPDDTHRSKEKIANLKVLSKELIRSVRMATFNLTPPELTDYGLPTALEKMARELSHLTGERIVFDNDGFTSRLEQHVEINLYRITQEAVNNAIKYARANYILVRLSAGAQLLSITVDDDGQGFDTEEEQQNASGTGLGLGFMEERVAFLGGRLFIHTEPGQGTRVTMNIPLREDSVN